MGKPQALQARIAVTVGRDRAFIKSQTHEEIMPKIDFSVALQTETGESVKRAVYDKTKSKPDAHGNLVAPVKTDAEGHAIVEEVTIADMLAQIVNHPFEGDEKLPYDQRVVRGRLARKLADKTKGSYKNYSTEELSIIKELAAKAGAATLLLAQLEDIIEAPRDQALPREETNGQAAA